MKHIKALTVIMTGILTIAACNKYENTPSVEQGGNSVPSSPLTTKALGDKSPALAVYVETNDVNPLNAGDYYIGSTPLFDIVELFASNIHKETVNDSIRPVLYLNDKLTPYLESTSGLNTYIRPLQNQGQSVVLTTLGDWQDFGCSNMNDRQAEQFATILLWAKVKYGLDGIGFDDEWANYTSTNSTSYSAIISNLRTLMPNGLITVFDIGGSNTIDDDAADSIDYVYYKYFGYPRSINYCTIAGMTDTDRWAPYCLDLKVSYNTTYVQYYASQYSSYGAFMCYDLRPTSDKNPYNVLQAMATGAAWGTISNTNGNRAQNITPVTGGYSITYDEAVAGLAAAGYSYL